MTTVIVTGTTIYADRRSTIEHNGREYINDEVCKIRMEEEWCQTPLPVGDGVGLLAVTGSGNATIIKAAYEYVKKHAPSLGLSETIHLFLDNGLLDRVCQNEETNIVFVCTDRVVVATLNPVNVSVVEHHHDGMLVFGSGAVLYKAMAAYMPDVYEAHEVMAFLCAADPHSSNEYEIVRFLNGKVERIMATCTNQEKYIKSMKTCMDVVFSKTHGLNAYQLTQL